MRPGSRGWWTLVAVYVVVLLSVQRFLGIGVDAFKARWGTAALDTTATLVVVLGGLVVAALLSRVWRGCSGGERLWLVIVLGLYGLGALSLEIPQERLHYLEYGVLAALVYIGLAADVPRITPQRLISEAPLRRAVLVAVVVTAGIGLLDEVLQEWLWPRRYFDWADVQLNIRAAVLGVGLAMPAFAGWRHRTDREA